MNTPAFRCPTCGSTALHPDPEGLLSCARCGTVYERVEHFCPQCQAANPPEAERCQACGHPLDMVRFILQTRMVTPAQRLEQVQQQAGALKQEAEVVSQERLRQWWKDEEERRRSLAQTQMERDRQERILLRGVILFAIAVLVGLLIYMLVASTGPGTPTVTPTPLP